MEIDEEITVGLLLADLFRTATKAQLCLLGDRYADWDAEKVMAAAKAHASKRDFLSPAQLVAEIEAMHKPAQTPKSPEELNRELRHDAARLRDNSARAQREVDEECRSATRRCQALPKAEFDRLKAEILWELSIAGGTPATRVIRNKGPESPILSALIVKRLDKLAQNGGNQRRETGAEHRGDDRS